MKRGKYKTRLGFSDFLVVLILFLIVSVVPLFFNNPITGKTIEAQVISPISLSKTSFAPNEQLTGNLKLDFRNNDLIPENSKMYFLFESPKCPKFFFCNDSSDGYILWCNYTSSGGCECIDTATINERCGSIENLACEDSNLPLPTFCCEQNGLMGLGEYYSNLNCDVGDCWGNCQEQTQNVIDMINLIETSTTPTKGNYTQGVYYNADKQGLIGGSGKGFGACAGVGGYLPPQQVPLFKGITGRASIQNCVDSDGDDQYTKGTCSDMLGNYVDYCSFENSKIVNEYVCKENYCAKKQYSCPLGCSDGKCTQQEECTDSDAMYKSPEYILGSCSDMFGNYVDYCSFETEGIVHEYYCSPSEPSRCTNKQINCIHGCENGVCLQGQQPQACKDSDADRTYPDGKDPYEQGTCVDYNAQYTDYCSYETEGLLYEYYCPEISPAPTCTMEKIICAYGCAKGRCLEYVPPKEPDLTASNIRHVQGLVGEKKLLVTISNRGEGTAGSFVACAYFKEDEMPPTCFVNPSGIGIRGLAAGASIDLELGNPNVEGKTVIVNVDYYDAVKESNENNNIIEKYFEIPQQCIDSDEGNLLVKGKCNDGTQTVEDECLRDGRTLKEWDCNVARIGGEICVAEFYDCIALGYDLGCIEGACKQSAMVECEDSDGKNYTQKGVCTDASGSHTDACISENGKALVEYYCSEDVYPSVCTSETHNCVEECDDGRCIQKYSCEGWNNRYEISLSSLALYAPPQEGEYNLTIKLVYPATPEIELTRNSALLIVDEETQQTFPSQTYKGCVDQQCVLLQGSGDDECSRNDECQGQDDTFISCINYFDLTECINAGCYWYDGSCHTSQKSKTPSLTAEPINLEQELRGISWWVWLIIGAILLLIIILFAVKKILPFSGKSSKEEKNEIRKKYPALVSYINRAKKKGMLREQLKAKLEEKGWPSGTITKAIEEFW